MLRPSFIGIVYLVVGGVVAANRDYFENVESLEGLVSAVLAVVLWPLLFLGVDLHVSF